MNLEQCTSFQMCEAPLCPLSEELDDCLWYPDEEICNSLKFRGLHWRRMQKRLKKYKASSDYYFTKEMLDDMKRCSKTTKGVDPDSRKAVELAGVGLDV